MVPGRLWSAGFITMTIHEPNTEGFSRGAVPGGARRLRLGGQWNATKVRVEPTGATRDYSIVSLRRNALTSI